MKLALVFRLVRCAEASPSAKRMSADPLTATTQLSSGSPSIGKLIERPSLRERMRTAAEKKKLSITITTKQAVGFFLVRIGGTGGATRSSPWGRGCVFLIFEVACSAEGLLARPACRFLWPLPTLIPRR